MTSDLGYCRLRCIAVFLHRCIILILNKKTETAELQICIMQMMHLMQMVMHYAFECNAFS